MSSARKANPADATWTAYYRDERGVQRQRKGFADKRRTEVLAQKFEDECRAIRDGIADPADRIRREAAGKTLASHIGDFRDSLLSLDNTPTYCRSRASSIRRLFHDAAIADLDAITTNRIVTGLGVWKGRGRSARTLNDALGAVREFCGWLAECDRIPRVPKGLKRLGRYNEDADRRLVRRAITKDELAKILQAAESGEDVQVSRGPRSAKIQRAGSLRWITGPERAALYRLAIGTGFRANELRTLTPECFRLDGAEPSIVIRAEHAKNGKSVEQPITRELAEALRPFLEGKPPGKPVLPVPEKCAKLLRIDLDASGIAYKRTRKGAASEGVVDMHALRHSYITHLIESGADPKVVQSLARHSDIRLTLDRYFTLRDGAKRRAIEPRTEGD